MDNKELRKKLRKLAKKTNARLDSRFPKKILKRAMNKFADSICSDSANVPAGSVMISESLLRQLEEMKDK